MKPRNTSSLLWIDITMLHKTIEKKFTLTEKDFIRMLNREYPDEIGVGGVSFIYYNIYAKTLSVTIRESIKD